jgi:hypothetical protein
MNVRTYEARDFLFFYDGFLHILDFWPYWHEASRQLSNVGKLPR